MWLVSQALFEAQNIERDRNHKQELPVALLSSIYANSQREKPPYTGVMDFCFFPPTEQVGIDSKVCDIFFELSRSELLPGWCISCAPIEELQKNRKGEQVCSPRAWMCKGLMLLYPRITEQGVAIGMAIASDNAPTGKTTLFDIDTNTSHQVVVPALGVGAFTDLQWVKL